MRVGCGSATIGMFAKQWFGKVDEVVVVDDHITGVLSEHQAGKLLGVPETGIKMKGRRRRPGDISRWRSLERHGAEPILTIRCRFCSHSIPRSRGRACAC